MPSATCTKSFATALWFVLAVPAAVTFLLATGAAATANPVFLPPFYNSGGQQASAAQLRDLNGDGKADLIVVNQCQVNACASGGAVDVLLGNGDGTFQPAVTYPISDKQTTYLAIGDVDGDGKLDLVVGGTNGLDLLLGNGDGTFRAAVKIDGSFTNDVVLTDVNGDGKLDLLVAGFETVKVLIGNGNGSFGSAVSYASGGWDAASLAVGDVNGDGKPDVVVGNACVSSNNCPSAPVIGVLLANGDGTFRSALIQSAPPSFVTGTPHNALADFNGDGKLDLATAGSVLLGNGDGTFQFAGPYPFGFGGQVAVADVNADGKLDLVVTGSEVEVLLGLGDGTFQVPVGYGGGSSSVAVGDVNGDGKLDVVATNYCAYGSCGSATSPNGSVGVLLGNGDGSFQSSVTHHELSASYLVAGDLNGDGKTDLIASILGCECIGVELGNGDGTFQPPVMYGSGANVPYEERVAIGDVNGDGKPDLLVGIVGSNSVNVLLGNGDGTFRAGTSFASGGVSPTSLVLGDVNGDGKLDLMVTNTLLSSTGTKGGVSVFLGNGDGTFRTPVSYDSGADSANAVAVADLNGDGKPDLVVANYCAVSGCSDIAGKGVLSVRLGNGDGTFGPEVNYDTFGYHTTALSIVDINQDGKLDLLALNDSEIVVFRGNGDGGTFQSPSAVPVPNPLQRAFALADFNGDGKLDLAIPGVLLPGNGDGTFRSPIQLSPIGGPTGLVAADFNGDGKPDLAINNLGISILLNVASNFHYATATAVSSSPNPTIYNQAVTLTATVATSHTGATPTGSVTFKFGYGGVIGTAPLTGGAASLNTTFPTTGTKSVVASYSGDTTFAGSTSTLFHETVNGNPTTTTLASNLNPALPSQAVTLTASVGSPGGGTPTGTVTFKFGYGGVIGTAVVSGGQARFNTSFASAGMKSILAVYSGDSTFAPSTSSTLSEVVKPSVTATTLTSSPNPSIAGQMVMLKATVTPQLGGMLTGTVTFKFGYGGVIGTVPLSGGQAALSATFNVAGAKSILAVYSGDASHTGSTSAVLTQSVN